MKYDIFKDEADKQSARDLMPKLEKEKAWEYIVRVLEVNIEYLKDELQEDDFDDLLEVKLRQKQIASLRDLLQLPQTIVQAAAPDLPDEDSEIY